MFEYMYIYVCIYIPKNACPEKGPMYPQKSPIYIQKRPTQLNSGPDAAMAVLCIYIYIVYIHIVYRHIVYTHKNSCKYMRTFVPKNICPRKSPVYPRKNPVYPQKRPTLEGNKGHSALCSTRTHFRGQGSTVQMRSEN